LRRLLAIVFVVWFYVFTHSSYAPHGPFTTLADCKKYASRFPPEAGYCQIF